MNRFVFAAALAVGIGIAHAQSVEQPEAFTLANIKASTTQQLAPPQQAGEPFRIGVDLGGQFLTLDLTPYSIRANDIAVFVNDENGRHEMIDVPDPTTYTGTVVGLPGSTIIASVFEGEFTATIDMNEGSMWLIEPMTKYRPGADPSDHIVYNSLDVIDPDSICGVPDDAVPHDHVNPGSTPAPEVLQILDLAIETDYEYYLINNQQTSRMISDIEFIMGRVNIIYERDVEVTIEISHMELRTANNDPYTSNDPQTLLNQLSNFWSRNMRSVPRDLCHMFSGRNFDGSVIGIAWLSGVCSQSNGYGTFQNVGLSNTGRIGVSAHEMGHNFSANHCSGGDCRIMCAGLGGCSGDISRFGSASKLRITAYKSSRGCMIAVPPPAIALPFEDTFPASTFTPDTWSTTSGTTITNIGVNPLSPPYVARMAQVATLESLDILVPTTLFPTPVFVSFWTQPRAVEAGETFTAQYRDSLGAWQPIETIVSDGSNPIGFTPHEFKLPAAAYGDNFRIRFSANGNETNDLWLIDNVSVSKVCLADMNGDLVLDIFDFLAFQGLFVVNNPRADLTGEGTFDIFDFLAFQDAFVAGCY